MTPDLRILISFAILSALFMLLLALVGIPVWRAGFLAVNLTTLSAFGLDKHQARCGGGRVPEAVLHMLAAGGGTPGAFIGMILFRHKTASHRFQVILFIIATIQLLILMGLRYGT